MYAGVTSFRGGITRGFATAGMRLVFLEEGTASPREFSFLPSSSLNVLLPLASPLVSTQQLFILAYSRQLLLWVTGLMPKSSEPQNTQQLLVRPFWQYEAGSAKETGCELIRPLSKYETQHFISLYSLLLGGGTAPLLLLLPSLEVQGQPCLVALLVPLLLRPL